MRLASCGDGGAHCCVRGVVGDLFDVHTDEKFAREQEFPGGLDLDRSDLR